MGAVANLSPGQLSVDPGALATATIKIRNTGSIVDRFDIDVVGPAAGWSRVDPPALSLFPGAEGSATISFGPPRASSPRAGSYPFGIRVRPAADPGGSAVEEGRITVTPFTAVAADIVPQTSRGSRSARHEVVVDNRGNAPSEVVVTATDPDRRLTLGVEPARAVVGPEQRVGFRVTVAVDDPFPFGPNRSRPFEVKVEPGRQQAVQLRATLTQRALLPGWIPRLGAIVLAAVAIAGVAWIGRLGPFAPGATPSPSAVAQVSAPPSEVPSVASSEPSATTPSAAPSAAEPPTPTPTPRPLKLGDFTLAVTGDDVALGNGLAVRCAANDGTCRNAAKDTIRTIVTELLNPYSGQGIVSTSTLTAANSLPVILSAPRDFPWRQLGAGDVGETARAVIDLGPLLANPVSYVYAVVDTADGQETRRFVVDPAVAKQLFDLLYRLPEGMGEVSGATPPPGMGIKDQILVQPINWDVNWLAPTPVP